MSATPEQNKDVVERLYREGINTGRFDTLRDLISGDFIGARGARDPAEFGQTISLPRRGFPDAHGTLEDLIAESDRVVARWEMAGTHLGPFAGFPASCNAVRPTAIVIYQLRNGKIVRVWRQPDSLGLMQQIGAIAPLAVAAPRA